MPRPCSICSHAERLEIDKQLLSGESYRNIAERFKLSIGSISRHREAHIGTDLRDIRDVMVAAREEALEAVKADEMGTLEDVKEEIITGARESIAARLELCHNHYDQLRVLRERAALALERAEGAEDNKVVLQAIRELRETVRLWAEIDKTITSQPQITIINNPEWVELRTVIISALEPYPEAREAVVHAINER